MIDKAEASRIAELAKLELSGTEAESLARDLTVILDYVEKLDELELDAALESSEPAMTLRADERDTVAVARSHLEEIAPEYREGFFVVPPVIG